MKNTPSTLLIILIITIISSCATSPTGRKQFILIGDNEMNKMGIASFSKMKTSTKISNDITAHNYVQCVSNAIINELPQQWQSQKWEVIVFDDNSANAFALPGGKIGIHTGLLKIATNQNQLATVIGHEIAHVLSRHGAERVSQQMGLKIAMQTTETISKNKIENQTSQKALMSALGIGAKFGVLLPFSRTHESEADLYGIELMAKAGFNPRQSINLWQNMAKANGNKSQHQFMSTHPNPENRINKLNKYMPKALALAKQAHLSGKNPNCQ